MFVLLLIPAAVAGYAAWGIWDSLPDWPASGSWSTWFQEQAGALLRAAVLLGVLSMVVFVLLAFIWSEVAKSGRGSVAGSAVEAARDIGVRIVGAFEALFGPLLSFLGALVDPLIKLFGAL